jgi:hypothetical protein
MQEWIQTHLSLLNDLRDQWQGHNPFPESFGIRPGLRPPEDLHSSQSVPEGQFALETQLALLIQAISQFHPRAAVDFSYHGRGESQSDNLLTAASQGGD